jgi:hypothetical protein
MTLPKKSGVSKAKKKKPATARKSIPQARKESKKAKLAQEAKKAPVTTRLGAKIQAGIGKDNGQKYEKAGQPTKKTPGIITAICAGIAVGKSARVMCVEQNIAQPTLWKWLNEDVEFSKQYARAKEDCADYLAGEILEIADTPVRGLKTTTKANGEVETVEGDMIEHRRLQVDARKWYASKLAPKKYGDRTVIAGDPAAPVGVTFKTDYEKLNKNLSKGSGSAAK